MDRLTERHLRTAERNRRLALSHLDVQPATLLSLPHAWQSIVAFYAAVHYINAYLWEIRRYTPSDHRSRNLLVSGDLGLRLCSGEYGRLFDTGYRARYVPEFRLSEQDARDLIDGDLELVRQTVRGALGLPTT